MKSVFQQFKNLQKDKLLICKKELEHLYRIVLFYTTNNQDNYLDKFEPIKDNIKILLEHHIKKLSREVNNNYNKYAEPYKYLTYYALTEKGIENIIEQIGLLSDKVTQNTEEYFDQYLPKALLGRRYSNKALTFFMETYFHKIAINYDKTIKEPIIVWEHSNSYTVPSMGKKSKILDKQHSLIKNAFWYYEIPRLIPNLVHEIGHLLNQTESYLNFQKTIDQNIDDKMKFHDNRFTEEIYGDLIGYQEMGASYIFALFYSTIYKETSNLFYNHDYKSIILPIPDRDSIIWRRFIETHIRISALVNLYFNEDKDNTSEIIEEHINNIQKFLNTYSKKDGKLYQLYGSDYPELADGFNNILETIDTWVSTIQVSTEHFNPSDRKNQTYKEIFLTLWKQRIENGTKWYHKNDLRKLLLNNVLDPESYNKTLLPYELVFFKVRTDTTHMNKFDNYTNSFFYDKSHSIQCYDVLGIYSKFTAVQKKETLTYTDVDKFLNTITLPQDDYYTIKFPLVKLDEQTMEPVAIDNINKTFGVVLQLQLKHLEESNINIAYQKLKKILYCYFNKPNASYESYIIFKALGPNDFIVIIKKIDLRTIFNLKDIFSTKDEFFRRTFSTIFLMESLKINKNEIRKISKDYQLISKIRLKSSSEKFINAIKNHIELKQFIKTIFYTTGVTDITIHWKTNILTINKIDTEFLLKLKEITKTSDIQTSIQKKIVL